MINAAYLKELGIELMINYNRKSRQDEELERRTGEDTLKSQRDLMDRILLPLDIPYEQKDEIGSGDKISTRPVFQEVIHDLRMLKYQAIAVKEISRMGRGSYTDMGVIYDLVVEKRIFIITPWKVYDPQNNADLRQIRFELFMSREEFETTRERLTGGRYNKAIEGRWMAGSPPFGYALNKATRKLEINPDEAETVRLIYTLYVNGIPAENGKTKDVGYRALCTYLKRINIKSPKGLSDWRTENLKYTLKNAVYTGTMKYSNVIVADAHPAMIDAVTWDKAQAKAARPSYQPRVRLDYAPYQLTGLMVCKACGRKMIRQYSQQKYTTKSGATSIYEKEFLWCLKAGCTFVKYRSIEADLLHTLRYLRDLDHDIMEHKLKQMVGEQANRKKTVEEVHQHKEKRLKELKLRMRFIYDKYERGIYSDDMFVERKSEIDKEMMQLETISNITLAENNQESPAQIDVVREKISSLVDAYKLTSDKSVKNAIFRAVFDHIVVEIIEKGHGSIPSKHVIYPVLKHDILNYDALV